MFSDLGACELYDFGYASMFCFLSRVSLAVIRRLGMKTLVVLMWVACLLHRVNPFVLFVEHFICFLYVSYHNLFDHQRSVFFLHGRECTFVFWHRHLNRWQQSHSINPSIVSPYIKASPNLYSSIVHIACCFPAVVCADMYNPGTKDMVDVPPPPVQLIVPPQIPPPAAPPIDELIQQSQWNLQQQEQHLHTLRQVQNKQEIINLPSEMSYLSFFGLGSL